MNTFFSIAFLSLFALNEAKTVVITVTADSCPLDPNIPLVSTKFPDPVSTPASTTSTPVTADATTSTSVSDVQSVVPQPELSVSVKNDNVVQSTVASLTTTTDPVVPAAPAAPTGDCTKGDDSCQFETPQPAQPAQPSSSSIVSLTVQPPGLGMEEPTFVLPTWGSEAEPTTTEDQTTTTTITRTTTDTITTSIDYSTSAPVISSSLSSETSGVPDVIVTATTESSAATESSATSDVPTDMTVEPTTSSTPVVSSTPIVTSSETTSSTSTVVTTTSSAPSPEPTMDEFAQTVVDYHNQVRAIHQAPPMVWNQTIADYASSYLDTVLPTCHFAHSGGPYGENLALGYPSTSAGMQAWYDENSLYDYSAGQFGEDTGHFTQMVWVGSTSVGCAHARCADNRDYLVCEYYPRGNVIGWFTKNVLPPVSS